MIGTLLVKNIWLADGTDAPLKKCSCLVGPDGNIAAVEKEFSACAAEQQIDGQGLILAPGFIDAHGHSDLSSLASPECFSKISQGVTAEICGNCGLSAFPVTQENRSHLQSLYDNYGVEINWDSCQEYLEKCRHNNCRMEIHPLCGHNTLRAGCCGYEDVELKGSDMDKMSRLLERELLSGAVGLSFGLLYTPGIFASEEEIRALMAVAARHGKVCTAHLRSEGDKLIESASEMIELSLSAGLKHFHFSHLKTAGRDNFSKLDRLLELFEEARSRGLTVTCDRYPYTESMTQLSVSLPGKWKKLDDEALKKLLSSTEEKQLLTEALRQEKDEEYWKRCRLVNVPHPRFGSWKNKTVSEIPGDDASNVVEILSFDPVNTQAAFAVMSEENMKRIISLPFCVAGSDGNALPADLRFGQTHPRSFGAAARFLRLNLDMNCPVENSVSRISGKTAGIFGLKNCGIIAPGKVGDMVLFDPDSIDCKGDFSAPATPAEGVVLVIKKGEIIYS